MTHLVGEATWRGVDRPWSVAAADVLAALGVDPALGLTRDQSAYRRREAGPNELRERPPVPAWRRFLRQLRDPLVVLLLVAVVVSLVVWLVDGAAGIPVDAIVIGVIVVLNAVLGLVQESKAERAVRALQRMAAVTSTVVRDGVARRVLVADLVPGDVVLLAEGDAVPADARVVEAVALAVSEASLTGESVPVLKSVEPVAAETSLADRTSMVHSGCAVVSGRGRAVVTATGMATEVGTVARLIDSTEQPPTPLQREVELVGRVLLRAVLVIAVVVMVAVLLTSGVRTAAGVVDVLLLGVSLAVAAVPEGLPAILSVVLALGVQRMARQRAVVRRLSSVETLGSASVICTDKTGTLTRNEMTVLAVVTPSGRAQVTGTGYTPEGQVLVDGRPIDEVPSVAREVRQVLDAAALANDARLHGQAASWVTDGDPTEVSLLVAAHKLAGRLPQAQRVGERPFTPERKRMSVVVRPRGEPLWHEGALVVCKGAPDVLLRRCDRVHVDGAVQPLDDGCREAVLADVDRLADEGLRTLGVAYRRLGDDDVDHVDLTDVLERGLVHLGLVGIMDPPRPEARAAVQQARRAGVRVLMITGDHPRTAARVAADLGLGDGSLDPLSGRQIDELDDDELTDRVRATDVVARVAPEHKLRIVRALQHDGGVVAMTGDGVNDAPALRAADIGVAMGVTGTEVTKAAADMVLADDNVATIVAAVREGRAIFADIRAFLRYLLSSNAGEVLTMLLGVLGAGVLGLTGHGEAIAAPLLATQILWINLLTDTAPALAMGLDPPPDDVMQRPPRRLTDRVIDRAMLGGVVLVGLTMAVVTLVAIDLRLPGGLVHGDGTLGEARTMAFTTLVLAQLFNCFNSRSDRRSAFHRLFTNGWLWGAVGLSLALQVAVVHVPWLSAAFGTVPLSLSDWLVCVLLASAVLWVDEVRKALHARRPRSSARHA
ncbi:MAG TPA: cation-translocating P-type ATPase [Actinomycetales bacterium]|nr:cation-translocating P-type ATPase [Actinomycetales bacterium]